MKKLIFKSILAGILISLAGAIYVNVENKIVGSLMFSIGLISVIILETNLFTGKVGYIDSLTKLKDGLFILIFNLVSAFAFGAFYMLCFGKSSLMDVKLTYTFLETLFKGIGCGALIYLACELYKKTNNLIVIILPVMAFILAGFSHCIADAFYFAASGFPVDGIIYLLIVILGNSIGSLLVRLIQISYEKIK